MQAAANSNLFLIESYSFSRLAESQQEISYAGFYQQIFSELTKGCFREQELHNFGKRLISLAEQACAIRQMDVVNQVSQLLLNLPLGSQYKNAGLYYHALCLKNQGRLAEARALLESISEAGPRWLRIKVLISLGTIYFVGGDFQSSLPVLIEARNATMRGNCFDPLALFQIQKNIAILKSVDGDHNGALADLERLSPLVRLIAPWYPHEFYNYLNSLAVDLGEVGRLEEASNASRIVLASPYAFAYPEWRETREDIERKGYSSRSFVAVTQRIQTNIVRLPEREHTPSSQEEPGRVLHFDWKSMVKEPNDTDDKLPQDATDKDIFLRIVQIATRDGITDKTLWKMLAAVEKIAQEQDKD